MNADMMDVSGWGPDYGDPQTYLDTMLPDYAGYMVKSIGIF
jgi:ABC-type oligopeptide transport system substrate-binding subunit